MREIYSNDLKKKKERENLEPNPRKRWLEGAIKMFTPKSCVEVILKDY
jgi:hypothetical protein